MTAPDTAPIATKRCSKCAEVKPLSDYYRATKSKDGLQYVCKACAKAASSAWAKANPEKNRAGTKRWLTAQRAEVGLAPGEYNRRPGPLTVNCVASFADADGRRTCLVHAGRDINPDRPFDGCGQS